MESETYENVNLGHILKCGREDSDLSQKRVMEITGINNKTLSGYENNISEPDFNTLLILFRLYKISIDDLIICDNSNSSKQLSAETMLKKLPKNVREDIYIQIKALYYKYCE